jgi:hypothetical protein
MAELHDAISALPQDGLQESAQSLVQALESAGEQREQYWINRVQAFWQRVWPKSRRLTSKPIAEQLARLAIAARGKFPDALLTLRDWLQPLEHPYYVVHTLQNTDLCGRFPMESLSLLDAVVDGERWPLQELDECLNSIAQAWPEVLHEHRYHRLREYLRKR